MDWPSILGTLGVLVVAVLAYVRSTAAITAAEDAKREAQRRAAGVEEELRAELELQRRMLAQMAKGEPLTAQMIEDGQLWRDVDPDDALKLVEESDGRAFVLDVRTAQETASGVVRGATLIPIDEIEERRSEIPRDGRPILVYCAAGSRSAAVCDHLSKEGYDALHNLTGGFGAWPGATESTKNP